MAAAAFVVNPRGTVHSVTGSEVGRLIALGYKKANKTQIAAWHKAQGLEVPKDADKDAEEDSVK